MTDQNTRDLDDRRAGPPPARALGAYGERLAARYLTQCGWRVVDRNWRCESGEVDLVALEGRTVVICEVKTRRHEAFGSAIEAVTGVKVARLRRLAGCWLEAHPDLAAGTGDVRLDVIGVLRPPSGPARLTHVRGVG